MFDPTYTSSSSVAFVGEATLATAAILAALVTPAFAQSPEAPAEPPMTPVVVIVKVPTPWYAPQFVVASKMRDTIAQYSDLPGLAFKAFSFAQADGDFGGVYFWKNRASADAWFNADWFERVRRERGNEGKVRMFEAPVSIDNVRGGTAPDSRSAAVATLVEIAVPSGVTRERIVAEFRAAVPTYQKVPGLLRKHFILSGSNKFGGVYVWKDEQSASSWFNERWHDRVRQTYGSDAQVEWFNAPILLPTVRADNTVGPNALTVAQP